MEIILMSANIIVAACIVTMTFIATAAVSVWFYDCIRERLDNRR